MSVTLPRLMLMACLLSPSLSWALGLGEIHLNSALNEPLNAEIDLVAAAPDELTALRASLASRESFTRYGIDRPLFLTTLSFKVGKSSKDGRDVLQVRSSDAIPEPFVTFLVEVNWARGRLMREYTVLLDPPVYTPGERASSGAPVSAPTVAPGTTVPGRSVPGTSPSSRPAPQSVPRDGTATSSGVPVRASRGGSNSGAPMTGGSYTVVEGDTLTKIVRSLRAGNSSDMDQTMIAVYRANPDAFGGNINILKRGAVLRLPGADDAAALSQTEAMNEVHRQMDAWKGGGGAPSNGHLRLVTPGVGGGTGTAGSGSESASTASAENQALKDRVSDLQSKLDDARRLLEVRNNELAALQHKLGSTATPTAPTPVPTTPVPTPPVAQQKPPALPPAAATPPPAPPATAVAPPPAETPPAETPPAATSPPTPLPPVAANPPAAPQAAPSESWLDWITKNYWVPAAVIIALLLGLGLAAWRRRQTSLNEFPGLDSTDVASYRDAGRSAGGRRDENFVVEESGEHPQPQMRAAEHFGETTSDLTKSADDTMSSESAVNLDQGDPLAEADFHMAYGLYDQAADLVRIALEREPDRRDLRMKLLEIYFVWGNKDQFLQTAKTLEATRDRAPAGEWDKIVIMGKQICPDEPMFQSSAGSGRGAGDVVDLNLEGGENRVDIDLFGDPEGEHSSDPSKHGADVASSGASPHLHSGSDLDFTLDSPERGADESPTREMPPRDEPTVESELMNFTDSPTAESPTLKSDDLRDRISSKLGSPKTDQTAEVSIDDLGLDLDHLEESSPPSLSHSHLDITDHPSDAPTMVAGLDEKSRRMMAEAESRSREKDMTELERELEASFVADLGPDYEQSKTAVLGPESAPTVQMPRGTAVDPATTSRFKSPDMSELADSEHFDVDSTSRLRNLSPADSIDLDLDKLASALGSGDTAEQPRAEDEVFSSEVFEATQRSRGVDLDVGESLFNDSLNGSESPTNKLQAVTGRTKVETEEVPLPELEPVTMSEVGTKLDLARAYMDMGDPEGARSILEEVVNEGSASQKQEAQRLIEALPG
jgi:pilus assembly protein FimV